MVLHYVTLLRDSKVWNTSGIEGVHRFLGRTWRLIVGVPFPNGVCREDSVVVDCKPTIDQLRSLHRCIEKVVAQLSSKLLFPLLFHFVFLSILCYENMKNLFLFSFLWFVNFFLSVDALVNSESTMPNLFCVALVAILVCYVDPSIVLRCGYEELYCSQDQVWVHGTILYLWIWWLDPCLHGQIMIKTRNRIQKRKMEELRHNSA